MSYLRKVKGNLKKENVRPGGMRTMWHKWIKSSSYLGWQWDGHI